MSEPRLSVRELSVSYGSVHAVRSVSFDVAPGETLAVLGPNGAGKSTTLRAIAGLVAASSGQIVLDGVDVTGTPAERLATRGLSLVPEDRAVFPRMTVEQNLLMGAWPRVSIRPVWSRGRDHRQDIEAAFARYPLLAERRSQRAGTLSGGEQAILALARALVRRPRLLLLDEPSLGLSPVRVGELFDEIAALRDEGIAVLVVEQYVPHALRVADRAVLLERGVVTFAGPTSELDSDRRRLAASYLGRPATRTRTGGRR